MSIIHDALKKAESERKPRGGAFVSPGSAPELGGRKRQLWQTFLSIGALLLGIAALIAAISLLISPGSETASSTTVIPQPDLGPRTTSPAMNLYAELPPKEKPPEAQRDSTPSVAPSNPVPPAVETKKESPSAQPQITESKPAKTNSNSIRPETTESAPPSLSISMSSDEEPVLKIRQSNPKPDGKIEIHAVGRIKTPLERSREKRAECLSSLKEAQRLADNGRNDLARDKFEESLSIEPDNELALLGYGGFLLGLGKPLLAEKYLRRGLALENGSKGVKSLLYSNLGLSLYRQGAVEEAIRAYQAAIAVNDENLSAYNNLAIAFKSLGKRELAKRTYSRLLVIDSKAEMAYYGLGLLNDEEKRSDEAIHNYSRFLVLAGSRHAELQEKVRKRIQALQAEKDEKKKRKLIQTESYIP
ncbi:MAG: tetratricopeptide repeat protein [Candidatus Coatesbacteria bacterium]|nr:tetratricopeptide repeat protein [Candidatus Coatesbacteria bacterium]